MDPRLSAAPVVVEFGELVMGWVDLQAFYVGGSLAGGDYRPGVSDLDAVAIIRNPLDANARQRLAKRHTAFENARPEAVGLHCIYADIDRLLDLSAEHPMWSDRRIAPRRLSAIARVELARYAITLHGASPDTLFPQSDAAALRSAARAELTNYWQRAVSRPSLWLNDWCIDLGLVTIARADAAINQNRLITKSEAIDQLGRYGVPDALAQEIRQRREGTARDRSFLHRVRRGRTARHLVAQSITELTKPPPAAPEDADSSTRAP